MKLIAIILLILIAGCAWSQVQDGDRKKRAVIYDGKGKAKEHVIIQGEHITIYDRDWKTKGYGKIAD